MLWHNFIFSNKRIHRNTRRVAGWSLWGLYVVFTIFFTEAIPATRGGAALNHHQPGLADLGLGIYSLLVFGKTFLLLLTHFLFCYTTIYVLLPNYLLRKKYWSFAGGLIIMCALMVPMGYFLYAVVYPMLDQLFQLQPTTPQALLWISIDAGLINGIKITLVVAAVALLKRWLYKQKEKETLEKEKISAELQLLKAQVHPAFLLNTLSSIISHAHIASPKAPEMLIKLSDLLSYMLYECDTPKVKLNKEIGMIREYISLEKIRQGKRLEITLQINGDLNGQLISPLLLLPFIDNSLSHSNIEGLEQAWINLDINIDENNLSVKIINGMPLTLPGGLVGDESLGNVQKRLRLLYPGRHELKINAEQELLMVHLNLKLDEPIPTDHLAGENK